MHKTIDKILRQLMADRGINQLELSRRTGITQSTLSRILGPKDVAKGIKDPTDKQVKPLADFFGLTTDQLRGYSPIDGQVASEPEEATRSTGDLLKEMLQKHGKGLTEEARQRLQAMADDQAELESDRGNVITADFSRPGLVGDEIKIPHYDVRAAMGGGQIPADYIELLRDVTVSQEHLRRLGVDYESPFHLKMITGWGQSMEPTIQDKDPLLIDVSIEEFTGDGIYLFTQGEMLFIKRLQLEDEKHLKVISDNRNHDPRFVTSDDIYIKGRILLVWNAHRV
ncbi:phage repressor [Pseudomonas psychrotolerans L19]|uniref:LexA family transcriptional regulator n=1 Tax=Pseudomonas oryzihabitans TaxID=47885 RepID=UPI00023A2A6B|nr:LexA family transcriptional regulator [Pseudomonas psychrotolerans]EHK72327.1 phage repressor [Pseudomonas psychrotolerans L19]